MTATFLESPAFPGCPAYGFVSDPEYSVSVTRTASGYEKRNQNWRYPLQRMIVTIGPRNRADIEIVHAFYHAVRGRTVAFRVKDWTDYKTGSVDETPTATDQPLIAIPGGSDFQLVKRYQFGIDQDGDPVYQDRPIYKPVTGTVVLSGAGTVDYATGRVTGGAGGTWGGEFDLPMRFDSGFPVEIENWKIHSVQFALQEIRVRSVAA